MRTPQAWSFTTAPPKVVSVNPADGASAISLDADVLLTFDQPFDPASVAENVFLLDSQGDAVKGEFSWDENGC